MEKVLFVAYHYSILSFILFSAYGLGIPLTLGVFRQYKLPKPMLIVFTIVSGLAVTMIFLFVVGTAGFLNKYTVLTLLLIGSIFAILSIRKLLAKKEVHYGKNELLTLLHKTPWWTIGIVAAPFFHFVIKPLHPVSGWDDVMYHLPYARFWAEQGALTVNEWLRYPLFPYNMNLLYAASLVFENNLLPKTLHGLSIALTVALTYSFARHHMSTRVAVVAAVQLLIATAWGWDYAYVDMGLMLFWSAAFFALGLRYQYGDRRFSYLATFFAGIAIGIKYQALFYLPIFAVLAFSVERRTSILLKSIVIFIVVGGYWYFRNFLLSGDPINPIGGNIFGFSYWNAGDLLLQLADFEGRRELPPWYLCLAIGSLFFWRSSNSIQKSLMLSALACFVVWAAIAQYLRYFVAIYPMLALLSAYFLEQLGAISWVVKTFNGRPAWTRKVILSSLLIPALLLGFTSTKKEWRRIITNEDLLNPALGGGGSGCALLRAANFPSDGDGGLYQLGFENEIYYLYHLTNQVRGDHFGPARYRDIKQVANNAPALIKHLKSLGVDSLLINIGRSEFANWPWDPNLLEYFDLVGKSDKAILYKIKKGL